MRIEGTLTKWNDDRGFGFITPTQGGSDVFVHISAFPKDGRRPAIGERLSFEIETDKSGKKRATNLLCPNRPAIRPAHQPLPARRNERAKLLGRAIPIAVIAVLAIYGYRQYSQGMPPLAALAPEASEQVASPPFRCDGRTHCSQMTSRAEAEFFLRNCPNTKMDGDGDGIPCENDSRF
jgi:cold shock CspA family protein